MKGVDRKNRGRKGKSRENLSEGKKRRGKKNELREIETRKPREDISYQNSQFLFSFLSTKILNFQRKTRQILKNFSVVASKYIEFLQKKKKKKIGAVEKISKIKKKTAKKVKKLLMVKYFYGKIFFAVNFL